VAAASFVCCSDCNLAFSSSKMTAVILLRLVAVNGINGILPKFLQCENARADVTQTLFATLLQRSRRKNSVGAAAELQIRQTTL
jgi:hypothetical protein